MCFGITDDLILAGSPFFVNLYDFLYYNFCGILLADFIGIRYSNLKKPETVYRLWKQ